MLGGTGRSGGSRGRRRDGRGHGQEKGEFERAILARQHGLVVARPKLVAESGEQHDANGDADHAQRQLEQAVGIIEPGHHAVLKRGDDGADHDGELGHAAGDDSWRGKRRQAPHVGGEARALPRQTHP